MHRSSSVYRCFSALAALTRFSHTDFLYSNFYASFAADGCIFHLETLARSLGDSCAEKEYLLALVDLARAAYMAIALTEPEDDTTIRTELLEAIHLQQYVPSPPTQSYLISTLSPERTMTSLLLPLAKRPLSLKKQTLPSVPPLTFLPVAP